MPALPSELDTEAVGGKLTSRAHGVWRPWSIWLPCALAFAWSGALVVADEAAAVMGKGKR